MLLLFTLLISVAVPILTAPQNGNVHDISNVKEVVNPTKPSTFEEKKVDPLVQNANIPISPINVTDSAKPCASCGKGPLLACPKDGGECGTGEACCYDTCRARQVCRPTSEIVGFKVPNGKINKREAENTISSVVDGDLESSVSRQNEDIPIPLDEEYDTFIANPDFPSQSFARSGSFGNRDSISTFAGNPNAFIGGSPQEFAPFGADPNSISQQFGDLDEVYDQEPFVIQQNSQPLIPVQQPVIIPQEGYLAYDEDEDEGGFLESILG